MSNVHDENEITNALPVGEKGESITINDKTFNYQKGSQEEEELLYL